MQNTIGSPDNGGNIIAQRLVAAGLAATTLLGILSMPTSEHEPAQAAHPQITAAMPIPDAATQPETRARTEAGEYIKSESRDTLMDEQLQRVTSHFEELLAQNPDKVWFYDIERRKVTKGMDDISGAGSLELRFGASPEEQTIVYLNLKHALGTATLADRVGGAGIEIGPSGHPKEFFKVSRQAGRDGHFEGQFSTSYRVAADRDNPSFITGSTQKLAGDPSLSWKDVFDEDNGVGSHIYSVINSLLRPDDSIAETDAGQFTPLTSGQ